MNFVERVAGLWRTRSSAARTPVGARRIGRRVRSVSQMKPGVALGGTAGVTAAPPDVLVSYGVELTAMVVGTNSTQVGPGLSGMVWPEAFR